MRPISVIDQATIYEGEMAADHETIKRLSTICSTLIRAQLVFVAIAADEVASDFWLLGYCYGIIDAICQVSKLDIDIEGLLLTAVVFDEILGGNGDLEKGGWAVSTVFDRWENSTFQEGVMQGGTDLMTYRNDFNRSPMGLVGHVMLKRKERKQK